jgi:hypothetical protein
MVPVTKQTCKSTFVGSPQGSVLSTPLFSFGNSSHPPCLGKRQMPGLQLFDDHAQKYFAQREPESNDPNSGVENAAYERFKGLDKICSSSGCHIAILRNRSSPGSGQATGSGSHFSNQPNLDWRGELGEHDCKTRAGGRQGKPSTAWRAPSALPAEPERCGDLEFHSVTGLRSDANHPT